MVYCSPNGKISEALKSRNIKYIPIEKMSYCEIKKVIEDFNPDIIHAHDFRASIYAAICTKRKKIISHLHNNPPFIKKWSIKTLAYYLCIKKFEKIVVVSKAVQNEAVFLNKNNSEKIMILNNFINKEEVLEKSNKININKKYDISFLGRLTLQKDPIKVLEIIKKINEKKPGTKAVLIGDGELREKCENYIKENSLENVVELKGFLDNPFPYIKNSKLLLMPSIFEGFGLVAIESMILGVPVLNSGVRRIINYI